MGIGCSHIIGIFSREGVSRRRAPATRARRTLTALLWGKAMGRLGETGATRALDPRENLRGASNGRLRIADKSWEDCEHDGFRQRLRRSHYHRLCAAPRRRCTRSSPTWATLGWPLGAEGSGILPWRESVVGVPEVGRRTLARHPDAGQFAPALRSRERREHRQFKPAMPPGPSNDAAKIRRRKCPIKWRYVHFRADFCRTRQPNIAPLGRHGGLQSGLYRRMAGCYIIGP